MKAVLIILTFAFISCNKSPDGLKWLSGSEDDKFKSIEKQLRGFDETMVEVGYRYNELFFAGTNKNWELASYHLKKIKYSIELGTERRPKRLKSSKMIFPVLKSLNESVISKNQDEFQRNYKILTKTCNACHQAEGVSYFRVKEPTHHLSPVN